MTKDKLMTMDTMQFERGRGNVFADLGLPDAGSQAIKAELVIRIDETIRRLGLGPDEAAKQLGLSHPDAACLLRGNFRDYSVERLLGLLVALGSAVRKRRSRRQGRLRVCA